MARRLKLREEEEDLEAMKAQLAELETAYRSLEGVVEICDKHCDKCTDCPYYGPAFRDSDGCGIPFQRDMEMALKGRIDATQKAIRKEDARVTKYLAQQAELEQLRQEKIRALEQRQFEKWFNCSGKAYDILPKPGRLTIACVLSSDGSISYIIGEYVRSGQLRPDEIGWDDDDEACEMIDGVPYCPKGWYESTVNGTYTHNWIDGESLKVIKWKYLPKTLPEDVIE